MHAIESRDLNRAFNGTDAVRKLNIEVRKGELFGLVGPDGAGKSTTLRMLASVLEPTSGDAWIAGRSVVSEGEAVKEAIGYMSQRFGLYEDLTVMENILFYADLYEVARSERPVRIERLLGFSNLTPFRDRLAGQLSGGMKQKLGLACSLIHTPEVLLLDEPTNGVDPVSRRDFWRILYDLRTQGVTILISTAYLDEAERCTRVALMHEGLVLMLDTPAALRRSLSGEMIELWTGRPRDAARAAAGVPGVRRVSVYGDKLHVTTDGGVPEEMLREALAAAGVDFQRSRRILPSLEDVFIAAVEAGNGAETGDRGHG